MKWILIAFLIAAAVFTFLLTQPKEDAGLVVIVHLVDGNDQPLPGARAQCVYAPGWVAADTNGAARLTGVILREGDNPGPTSLPPAIEVDAPYAAARGGRLPEVEQRDGTWHVTYRLTRFGILRLGLVPSKLPGVHAFVEADPEERRWEAIGGYHVARHPTMVSYRVYAGVDRVPIRLQGDMGVAMRRIRVAAPTPGHTREQILKPEGSREILGTVGAPDGSNMPSLSGHVHVDFVDTTGQAIEMPSVVIQPNGRFIVPYAGEGKYRLRPELPFVEPLAAKIVEGGHDVRWDETTARPFVRLRHAGVDSRKRRPQVTLAGDDAPPSGGVFVEGSSTVVALPTTGRHELTLRFPGTVEAPPQQATVRVDALQPGAQPEHDLALEVVPHATIEVGADAETLSAMRGATVFAGSSRRMSWMKGLQRKVTLPHLDAPASMEVRVHWADSSMAVEVMRVDLAPDATARVDVGRVAGGYLALLPRRTRGAGQKALTLHLLPGETPYGDLDAMISLCPWDGQSGRWQSRHALKPGIYRARVDLVEGDHFGSQEIRFEIRTGEVSEITLGE